MKFLYSLLFLIVTQTFFFAQNFDEKSQFISRYLVTMEANYLLERTRISLNENLQSKLIELKKEYKKVLSQKNDKNNGAFYNYFNYYPDINAVFLNKGNFLSNEKLSDEEKQKYAEKFVEISKLIPNDLYLKISDITDEIKKEKTLLIIPYKYEIFQDFFDDNARKRIEIINFLLWNLE